MIGIALLKFLIYVLVFSGMIYITLAIVEREIKPSFTHSFGLGLGITIAMSIVTALLAPAIGVIAWIFALFAAFAILHRYARLSEYQALAAVGVLLLLDLGLRFAVSLI